MKTGSLTTLKSTAASIGLHVIFLLVGSFAVFQNSHHALELTGASGSGNKISLSGFSFGSKKTTTPPKISGVPTRVEKSSSIEVSSSTSSTGTVAEESSVAQTGSFTGSGSGNTLGSGSSNGVSAGDADNGALFSQIKSFFENRLGSTLKIRETQLIKIKVFLNAEGEVQDATLAQGSLEGSLLRRVLSVAKNIPFKSYWKSGSFPKELIFPIVLTPQ